MVGVHPLGLSPRFHKDLKSTTSRDHTLQFTAATQDLLIEPPWRPKNRTGRVKLTKDVLAENCAHRAGLYRSVPCRVRSGVPVSENTALNMKHRSVECPRDRGEEATRAHPCDVLGPQACADCIRVRQRRRLRDDTNKTFPGLDTNQRALCWPQRVKALVSPRRLPPLEPGSGGARPQGSLLKDAESDSKGKTVRYNIAGCKGNIAREQPAMPPGKQGRIPEGVDYGDFGNIRLASDYTRAGTETLSAVRRKRQPGAVTEPELHQRVMRKRMRKEYISNINRASGLTKEGSGHRELSNNPLNALVTPQRTVTIVIPTVEIKKKY